MKKQLQRLKYTRVNNSDNVISIDLYNGYHVVAISGWSKEDRNYITSLYLKEKTVDNLELIEEAEKLKFNANHKTINSAILKQVATYLENGFLDRYIQRYEYELKCFAKGNDFFESENAGVNNV